MNCIKQRECECPKCVEDIATALKFVSNEYTRISGINCEGNLYDQAGEHAFVAELYHQLKTIIEHDESGYYNDLLLHFDLTKRRFLDQRPDLVLHHSPHDRKRQEMYVEVKTAWNVGDIVDDLQKLIDATSRDDNHNKLGYKYGVMIMGNITKINSQRLIQDYPEIFHHPQLFFITFERNNPNFYLF